MPEQPEMEVKDKATAPEAAVVGWNCVHNCLLALPVLGLLGAVLLLGGHFDGHGSPLRQLIADLDTSSVMLSVTKHLSEETALSHVFWLHQSEEARTDLQQHITVTDQLLLEASQWLPSACVHSLQLHGDSDGLFQRFLRARAGVEFNETPLELERQIFYEFVFRVAACPLDDTSRGNLRGKELKSATVYYNLLAASICLQHVTVWLQHECSLSPANATSDVSRLTRGKAYSVFADFLSTNELVLSNASSVRVPHDPCSEDFLSDTKDGLDSLIAKTTTAQASTRVEASRLVGDSNVRLFCTSVLVVAAVVFLCLALYVFGSTSHKCREMTRLANVILTRYNSQSEERKKALELCLPREATHPARCPAPLSDTTCEENFKVSATVLALELAQLGRMIQDGDCSAALWVMTHVLSLVEERVQKHQAFVLQQQATTCLVAAVSYDSHCSSWSLCNIADLALDLMTSLADVELSLTSDGRLRPRFAIHTGQAIGYVGVRSPTRYCLVGDVAATAMTFQRLSEPNCVRLSWNAYSALQRLGHYICTELPDSGSDDDRMSPGPSVAFYLAGKRTCRDEVPFSQLHSGSRTPWVFHYI